MIAVSPFSVLSNRSDRAREHGKFRDRRSSIIPQGIDSNGKICAENKLHLAIYLV